MVFCVTLETMLLKPIHREIASVIFRYTEYFNAMKSTRLRPQCEIEKCGMVGSGAGVLFDLAAMLAYLAATAPAGLLIGIIRTGRIFYVWRATAEDRTVSYKNQDMFVVSIPG